MPKAFHKIEKKCEICGIKLVLNNSRDIERKKFCSHNCFAKYQWEIGKFKILPITEIQRGKMRQSKLELLKTGWKPTGWKKYPTQIRIGGRGYKMLGVKREHQILMENLLGRPLNTNEVIHHKNFNKADNRIDNLELMSRSNHIKLHLKLRKLQCLKISMPVLLGVEELEPNN